MIVPAFNAAPTIGASIRSIIAQTYQPIEIVVVDDGSTDGTADVARSFGGAIRCIVQANAGDAAARNTGIAASTGTYVAFLDADDLWLPEKLAAQVAVMERDLSIGATQCGAVHVDAALQPLEVRRCQPGRMTTMDVLRFRDLHALSSSLVVRRACLERIGPIDLSVRGKDEWDLAIRLARHCGLWSVPDALVLFRIHRSSMSRRVAYVVRQIAPGLEILRRLFADPTIPSDVAAREREAYAAFYAMIAGSYLQVGRPLDAMAWGIRAVRNDPLRVSQILTAPARWLVRVRARGGASALLASRTIVPSRSDEEGEP
ncbi:MAG: glycosyltransferase [Elusimicrobia bacterium]|nr:glycosyltransferase [Elusimicrobiota bacterium]